MSSTGLGRARGIFNSQILKITLTSLIAALACAGVIYAATTIGTNISTDGALSATGLTTLGNASSTLFSVSGNTWLGTTIISSGNLGIGTTSPYAKLSVVGETVASYFTATSTTATSTLFGGLNVGSGGLIYDFSSGNTSITGDLTVSGDAAIQNVNTNSINNAAPPITIMRNIPRSDITVPINAYGNFAPASGAGNFGNASSREYLLDCPVMRIRQSGDVEKVKMYLANKTGMTALYVKIWRPSAFSHVDDRDVSAGNSRTIAKSEDILASLTAGQVSTVTLTNTLKGVRVGDFVGLRIEGTGMADYLVSSSAVYNACNIRTNNSTTEPALTTTVYEWWTNSAATANSTLSVELQMKPPTIVFAGDSMTAGGKETFWGYNHSNAGAIWADDTYNCTLQANAATCADRPDRSYPALMARFLGGATYQNMGVLGNNSAMLLARLQADVLDLYPKMVVLWIGVNSATPGGGNEETLAVFSANLESILAQLQAAYIQTVVIGIEPTNNDTFWTANYRSFVMRDLLWNPEIERLAEKYNASYVDVNNAVGAPTTISDWVTSTAYLSYEPVTPTTDTGFYYYASAACTSSGSEPTWNATVGSTSSDSGCSWINAGSQENNRWTISSAFQASSISFHYNAQGYSQIAQAVINRLNGGGTTLRHNRLEGQFPTPLWNSTTAYDSGVGALSPINERGIFVHVVMGGDQTVTNGTTVVANWSDYKGTMYHGGIGNNNQFNFGGGKYPIDMAQKDFMPWKAGVYLVVSQITFSDLLATERGTISLRRQLTSTDTAPNCSTDAEIFQSTAVSQGGNTSIIVSGLLNLNGFEDNIFVCVTHDAVAARTIAGANVNTYFIAYRLGD